MTDPERDTEIAILKAEVSKLRQHVHQLATAQFELLKFLKRSHDQFELARVMPMTLEPQ